MTSEKYNAALEQGLKHYKAHGFGYGVYANMEPSEMVVSALLDGATEEEVLECVSQADYERGLTEANNIRNQSEEEKESNLRFGAEVFGHGNDLNLPEKK
jgi:hypothetical protein